MSRRAVSTLALVGMLGGYLGPLVAFTLDTPTAAPFCGRDGRCCCDHGAAPARGVACVRSQCGCGRPEAATPALPLPEPAVLAEDALLLAPPPLVALALAVASLPPSFLSPPLLPPPRVVAAA